MTFFTSTFLRANRVGLLPVEQRLIVIAIALAALAFLGALFGQDIAYALGLQLNGHGHTHLYAHGHPFIDARTLAGIPNAWDVLTNIAFFPLGLVGLWSLHCTPAVHREIRQAARVFFVGLVLTSATSSFYHWAPSTWGLAIDRAGMAVAFAGVLGLATAERVSLRAATWVWAVVAVTGMFAIAINYATGLIAPWAVVQFGGMAVVLWAATQLKLPGALGIRWGALIAIYILAKLFELGDEAVFHATHEFISGHSLKHLVASAAALPVIYALRHNATQAVKA